MVGQRRGKTLDEGLPLPPQVPGGGAPPWETGRSPPLRLSSDFRDNNPKRPVTYLHINNMARKTKAPKAKEPELDDDILDDDSEVDEFENYKPGMAEEVYSGEDDEEGEFDSEAEFDSEEEGDGVGVYEPDDWDDNASASDSGSDDDDEGASMVSCRTLES